MTQLGGETWIGTHIFQQQLSPAIVGANTSAEQSFVVPSLPIPAQLLARAVAFVNKPTAQAGLAIVGTRVIDATHIGVTFGNFSAAGITPTAGETYDFVLHW